MSNYDVIIVGGGLSGLYTAWRLGKCTNLSIAVLEASSRFGGRLQTCTLPGGFKADLGAMRFLPVNHLLMSEITQQLGLDREKLFYDREVEKSSHRDFFRNRHVRGLNDLKKLYSIREKDIPYFSPAGLPFDLNVPANGYLQDAEVGNTGQLAKDMSVSQYMSLSMNPDVLARGDDNYPLGITVADMSMWNRQFETTDECHDNSYYTVVGGMEKIAEGLIKQLAQTSVKLLEGSLVTRINEHQNIYTVEIDGVQEKLTTKKVILACNSQGIKSIDWNSPHNRTTRLVRLFSKVVAVPAVKLFLTYKCAWWEQAGLKSGTLHTDLPIENVTAFGSRGKKQNFATLLTAFTYNNTAIFEGLNRPRYKRFQNLFGVVPEKLTPSQLFVDYVQEQLKLVFGMKEIPQPLCAVAKLWTHPGEAADYYSEVGVDSYQLQFEGLKPFADADVYITGDTFAAFTKEFSFCGWGEGVLLNSERILVNHFGLEPLVPNVPLHNEFPNIPLAKL